MNDQGTLTKLKIEAYDKPDYTGDKSGEFSAYINPNEITVSYEIDYDGGQGSGTTNSTMAFKRIKPGDMTISFFIDGTGANGNPVDVQGVIKKFQDVTGYDGNIHRTKYLLIAWGTIDSRRCVLKSVSIVYKLFKPNGVPLRAVLTATFTDNSDDQTRVAKAKDKSPDLTHMRIVKGGDVLPALCYQIYGDPGYYLEVARANRLDNFRNIAPGTRIFFPPLEK